MKTEPQKNFRVTIGGYHPSSEFATRDFKTYYYETEEEARTHYRQVWAFLTACGQVVYPLKIERIEHAPATADVG